LGRRFARNRNTERRLLSTLDRRDRGPLTETYTFYISHDDGARVWIGDTLVVDNWTDHAAVEDKGTIDLVIGKKYPIKVEFFENSGDASCQLSWSSNSIAKAIIPKTQLYNSVVSTPTPTATMTSSPTTGPTPTPTPTPTSIGDGYAVSYTQNDWGSGATVTVTIKNNGTSPVDGWTLVWSFGGNQTITNLWNGSYTQSGTSVTVKNVAHNAAIPAGGGTVSFGFNISYSGSNPKPTGFTLNGSPCGTY
jgi:hypothetical protein